MGSPEQEFIAMVSENGQVTVPPELLTEIDSPGFVRFVRTDSGDVLLRPVTSATELRGVVDCPEDEEGRSALELLRDHRSAE